MAHRAFRATIDFVVFDDADEFADVLTEEAGSPFGDQALGVALTRNIAAGVIEIDAVSDIEVHD